MQYNIRRSSKCNPAQCTWGNFKTAVHTGFLSPVQWRYSELWQAVWLYTFEETSTSYTRVCDSTLLDLVTIRLLICRGGGGRNNILYSEFSMFPSRKQLVQFETESAILYLIQCDISWIIHDKWTKHCLKLPLFWI